MNYIKEIWEHADGRFEIEVCRDGKKESHFFNTEDEAFNAYIELCGEIYV